MPGCYEVIEDGWMCEDCGALVMSIEMHDRFHAILNDHARAIAVLVNSHLGPKPHEKFDVGERIGPTPGTSWSREVFDEVASGPPVKTGWQRDGSYVPCEECHWTPYPEPEGIPGFALRNLHETGHRKDCPTVPRFTADQERDLRERLDEMDRVRSRGAAEGRNFFIG